MQSENEKVADIVKWLRNKDYYRGYMGITNPLTDRMIGHILDRIEVAHRREIESLLAMKQDYINLQCNITRLRAEMTTKQRQMCDLGQEHRRMVSEHRREVAELNRKIRERHLAFLAEKARHTETYKDERIRAQDEEIKTLKSELKIAEDALAKISKDDLCGHREQEARALSDIRAEGGEK